MKWNGLLNSEKVSPLAYAVYVEWLRNTATVSNIGVVAGATENGTLLPIASEIQRASSLARELFGYAGQDAYAGSLYNFLTKYLSDYPEWIFNEYRMLNSFGI